MEKRKIGRENKYCLLIIIITIISIVPLLVLSFYNQPSADDFSCCLFTYSEWKENGSIFGVLRSAIETSKYFWNNWQGVYSSMVVMSLSPSIFGEEYYFIATFILIGVILITNIYFSLYIFNKCMKTTRIESLTWGMMFSFLMIQWIPSVVQGLYWWNGAVHYVFFYCLLEVWICVCIGLNCEKNEKKLKVKIILVSLIGVVLEGGNLSSAFMGILFLVGEMVLFILMKKLSIVKRNIPVFVSAIVGFVINISSPGTAIRQSRLEDRKLGVFLTLVKALVNGMEHIGNWLGVPIIVCCVIMLPFILKLVKRIYKENRFEFKYPLIVLIFSFGWICAMICPPIYGTGSMGAGRLTNIVYFSFVILVFVNVIYFCGWTYVKASLKGYEIPDIEFDVNWWFTMFVLAIGMLLATGRETACFKAVKELYTGEAEQYAQEAKARWELYENSMGKDVVVGEFSVYPELLFFDDLTDDADDWINEAIADYYGLNSVVRTKKSN